MIFPPLHFKSLADTGSAGYSNTDPKLYVVQTDTTVVQRCILMTTDPGDLILDPTCGSGTTADVGEQWGRRWITIDTSRVPIALARQRIVAANYPYFELTDERRGPAGGLSISDGNQEGSRSRRNYPVMSRYRPSQTASRRLKNFWSIARMKIQRLFACSRTVLC